MATALGGKVTLISDPAFDRLVHFCDRVRPELCLDRYLGRGDPRDRALHPRLGIGGEWGGATLITMEWATTNAYRGLITHGRSGTVRPAVPW